MLNILYIIWILIGAATTGLASGMLCYQWFTVGLDNPHKVIAVGLVLGFISFALQLIVH